MKNHSNGHISYVSSVLIVNCALWVGFGASPPKSIITGNNDASIEVFLRYTVANW
jgi:hypothetical protein